MSVQQHYKEHLSKFYTWMFGDFGGMVARQKEFFERYSLCPRQSKVAIDLGCGPGFQSIALSELGFKVHAVDFSEELLSELKERDSSIETYCRDIRDLGLMGELRPELAVCMGDTLTHLSSQDEVTQLLQGIHSALEPQGRVVLTFRDLGKNREDLDRFILVKSDLDRILTCFLEDEKETVKVFDLLHEKDGQDWVLKKSFYRKLKLSASWVGDAMRASGFQVQKSQLPSGMEVVIGQK